MLVVWYMGKTPYVVWCYWRSGTIVRCHCYSIWLNTICMWYGVVGGIVRGKHSMWYGTLAVWYDGTVSWIYYLAKFVNFPGGMVCFSI